MMQRRQAFKTLPDDYGTLCRSVWLPRPIRDKADHAAALAAIEPLWGHEKAMNQDQADWFEMVADLGRLLELEPSMGSKIINGTRQLTTAHIRRLARHFALPADYFLEV